MKIASSPFRPQHSFGRINEKLYVALNTDLTVRPAPVFSVDDRDIADPVCILKLADVASSVRKSRYCFAVPDNVVQLRSAEGFLAAGKAQLLIG